MTNVIDSFTGEYRFLSNFSLAPIEYEGLLYPATEHAYQAAKTLDHEKRKAFVSVRAGAAKQLGRQLQIRPDWEDVKYDIMYQLCKQKFTRHAELTTQLLATGYTGLIEGNKWHDNYWGSCRCTRCGDSGRNALGIILMRIRREILQGIRALGTPPDGSDDQSHASPDGLQSLPSEGEVVGSTPT